MTARSYDYEPAEISWMGTMLRVFCVGHRSITIALCRHADSAELICRALETIEPLKVLQEKLDAAGEEVRNISETLKMVEKKITEAEEGKREIENLFKN